MVRISKKLKVLIKSNLLPDPRIEIHRLIVLPAFQIFPNISSTNAWGSNPLMTIIFCSRRTRKDVHHGRNQTKTKIWRKDGRGDRGGLGPKELARHPEDQPRKSLLCLRSFFCTQSSYGNYLTNLTTNWQFRRWFLSRKSRDKKWDD